MYFSSYVSFAVVDVTATAAKRERNIPSEKFCITACLWHNQNIHNFGMLWSYERKLFFSFGVFWDSFIVSINWEISVSTKFWICNFCVQMCLGTSQLPKIYGNEKFSVLNFLLTCGITGHPSKLILLQRSCAVRRAFVVAIAYGIQLLERESCNVVDRYHSNQHCIASNRKRLTV